MTYRHQFLDGSPCDLPVGKAVCVGRNYAAHARELGNAVPEAPILFIKPKTAFADLQPLIVIPAGRGECHHETEITVLIGQTLRNATVEQIPSAIAGYGLGLDLTLRDIQNELKKKGLPWEIAKAFDAAAPLGPFFKPEVFGNVEDSEFWFSVNGKIRQHGFSRDMITSVFALIAHISTIFTLEPGDVVFTGTPEGVAALQEGDLLVLGTGDVEFSARVVFG